MKLRYLFAVGLLSVLGACSKSHEATPAEPAATPVETAVPAVAAPAPERSEEYTSELQSLMRNSYAVFCLQKKTSCHNHYTSKIKDKKQYINHSLQYRNKFAHVRS